MQIQYPNGKNVDEEKLGQLLANEKFRDTWERNRPEWGDQSASSYCLGLANWLCMNTDLDDQAVADILHRWASEQSEPNWLNGRLDKYTRTIGKAWAWVEEARTPDWSKVPPPPGGPGAEAGGDQTAPGPVPKASIYLIPGEKIVAAEYCIDALAAANPPEVYRRGNTLGVVYRLDQEEVVDQVRIPKGTTAIHTLNGSGLLIHLVRVANFYKLG